MNNKAPFDAVFCLQTSRNILAHVANEIKSKPPVIDVLQELTMIDHALSIGINKINELKAHQELSQNEAITVALADQQIKLNLMNEALHAAIQTNNTLKNEQSEAQAAFSEGETLASELIDALSKPPYNADKALYNMAESLYFLLSERVYA